MPGKFPLGKGRGLTADEVHEFLTETAIFAKLGTIGPDGWPAVNPVWYEYDGGAFYIVTKELTGFCQNLRRDARTTLCIDNPQPPYKRVIVRATAEFIEEDWIERARRMVLRYLGPGGMDYFEATLDLPRVPIRLRPVRFSSWNGGGIDRTFSKPAVWHDIPAGQALEEVAG